MASTSITEQAMCFSKSVYGELNLTTNFKVREFACKDGTDPVIVHPLIPFICQMVRNHFNMPFTPNSGYRSVAHNKSVGGSSKSNHTYGRAVDIPAKNGVTPQQIYDFLDDLFGDWGQLGIYSWGVHVGITDTKSRFKG